MKRKVRQPRLTKRLLPQRSARGVATAAPSIVPKGKAPNTMPIWESDKEIDLAAAGKKDEGREKIAHCVIITSDIRSMNLNRWERVEPMGEFENEVSVKSGTARL